MPLTADLNFKPFGQRVYDGRTHAVQAARNLIAAAAEFTARVQNRQYNCHRRQTLFLVHIHGNTASVVAHGYHVIGQNFYFNMRTVARQRLVHRVIDNFINQVVQSLRTC